MVTRWPHSILCTAVYFLVSCSLMAEVTKGNLQASLSSRLSNVQEFAKIKELAEKKGIKELYLFGGTASAWAHYVYADLKREDGDRRYQVERFDYDFTSIFRSNQDMDIVIDGTADQAEKLEEEMGELFPFFQGKKSVFEVRLLKESRGDKDAILNNPDFLDQNTDSHSTGLIKIVGDGDQNILDVKDMDQVTPQFLKDVYEKKLHYYFNHSKHIRTKRFKEGKNPVIISVVRYLTKLFQYDLTMDAESEVEIKKIISAFTPADIAKSDPYVTGWLERNGTKLFQNAINVEHAWDTLEKLGLRKKLIAIKNSVFEEGSLAWWLSKEPLRSHSIGLGDGATAKELNIDIVAHETRSFEAYESITKSYLGAPNVFISRGETGNEFIGEQAAYGDGFYVRIGKTGGRGGSGLTIRFRISPDARLGSDFLINNDNLTILNKEILRIIPESMEISPLHFFKKLAQKEILFDATDAAVLEKVKRKVLVKSSTISKMDELKIASFVRSSIQKNELNKELLINWFSLPISKNYPAFILTMLKEKKYEEFLTQYVLSDSKWSNHPEWILELFKSSSNKRGIIIYVLSKKIWSEQTQLIELLLKDESLTELLIHYVLSQEHWKNKVEWILPLLKSGKYDRAITMHLISKPYHMDKTNWIELILKRGTADEYLVRYVLSNPYFSNHPEWLLTIIKRNPSQGRNIDRYIFSQEVWANHSYFKKLISDLPVTAENLRTALENQSVLKKACSKIIQVFI